MTTCQLSCLAGAHTFRQGLCRQVRILECSMNSLLLMLSLHFMDAVRVGYSHVNVLALQLLIISLLQEVTSAVHEIRAAWVCLEMWCLVLNLSTHASHPCCRLITGRFASGKSCMLCKHLATSGGLLSDARTDSVRLLTLPLRWPQTWTISQPSRMPGISWIKPCRMR